ADRRLSRRPRQPTGRHPEGDRREGRKGRRHAGGGMILTGRSTANEPITADYGPWYDQPSYYAPRRAASPGTDLSEPIPRLRGIGRAIPNERNRDHGFRG